MQVDATRRLNRKEAASFLTERGFRIAPATLAKYATTGGGPEFEVFGRTPLYRQRQLLEWATSRTSPPRRSTSDVAQFPAAAADNEAAAHG